MSDAYRFGRFTLDPNRRTLTRDGADIAVTPKAFDLLLYLVQHPNRVVTKQDLMKAVWPDTIVEEGNLTQNLSLLRKVLAEHGEERLIVTVARQGYQFTADVSVATHSSHETKRWPMVAAATVITIVVIAAAAIGWQRFRNAPVGVEKIRLAVLPFENLTGDSAQDYLADGLTEELITQLARLQPAQLGVIARTSVMQYKHTAKRMDEIGRDLSVQYAIESSLRRNADRLRATVQLIRIADQSHVWANDFDYTSHDILRVQDSVAGAVALEVQLRVTPAQRALSSQHSSTNAMAIDDVMRGRELMRSQRGKGSWSSAKHYIDRAIARDSGYALAWAWLAVAYRFGGDREYMPADSGLRAARQAVDRALTLDPSLPEAWGQRGQLQRLVDWDWEGARASYQRALTLDSGNVDAILNMSAINSALGRVDEAIALDQHAVDLDPLDPQALGLLGTAYYDGGRLDQAAKHIEQIPREIRSPLWNEYLVEIYLAQGRVADAASMVTQVADSEFQLLAAAFVYTKQGRRQVADSALAEYIERYHAHSAFEVADIYAFRGEADSAFAWLDRAYAQRDQGLTEVKVDPNLRSLRGDPRYGAFLTKMRLPL